MFSKNVVIIILAIAVSCFVAAENGRSFHTIRTPALRKNGEKQAELLRGRGGKVSNVARAVLEVDETDVTIYKVGTPVSVKNFDGSWTNGIIAKYDKYGYTIKWDHGEKYIVGQHDGEIHQLVKNAITENSISIEEDIEEDIDEDIDEDIEDIPLEILESEDSKGQSKKSTIVVLFFVGLLVASIWYVRHNKLVAISSTKKSQGGIWGKKDQRRTSLSIQMDETKNLHSIRNIM